jgi:hypothetical protein
LRLVVEGFELVVAGRLSQLEHLNNRGLFGGQPGALRDDGPRPGVVGVQLDTVELVRPAVAVGA